jgi:hypothetical protein
MFAAILLASSRPPPRIAQLLIRVQTYPVEYRGIRYTIRAGIEREQWSVTIHPAGVEMKGKVVSGPREKAELQALALIDSWLKGHSTQNPKSN